MYGCGDVERMWKTDVEKWKTYYVNVENVEEMWITIVEKWKTRRGM